jgi:hypothetical protein
MANFPLGGQGKDYDSKKSRGIAVNLIPEGNKDGSYRSVRRTEGLTLFATLTDGPVRSDPLVNAGYAYIVSGASLFRVNSSGAVENLGAVNGSGRAKLAANAVPGDSQILILNGSGDGFIYDNANGLVPITDPDFFPSSSVTVLNERFWLVRDDTNEFFGSDISNGTSYNPLTSASAEESPDNMVSCIAKKSAFWAIGSETTEYWQTFSDVILPLRQVKGATKEWGILAKDSLAEVNDFFAFLADDRTIRMIQGTQLVKISDLEFELKVKGNGTATYPGFSKIDDAIGFFVDGPIHSTYYITFPTEGYTWGYDLNTGMSHIRESNGLGLWRVNSAVKFGDKIICGDSIFGKLWILDINNKTEDGEILRAKLVTPTISYEKDATIPLIEIDMEVAQTDDPTADPKMIVYFTKDGGNTRTNMGHISLGKFGEHRKRVPLRRFGRLVRNKDFGLELEITDAVGVQFYGAYIYPRMSM